MHEQRRSERIAVEIDASYIADDGKRRACRLINISREGTGIELFAEKTIAREKKMCLDIAIPLREEPLRAEATIKWMREISGDEQFNYVAGGLLNIPAAEDRELLVKYVVEITLVKLCL